MNIKEHIEAGHYPAGPRGSPLVKTENGLTYEIVRTDNGELRPLVGMRVGGDGSWVGWQEWNADGGLGILRILPPAPRKVTKVAWLLVREGRNCDITYSPLVAARWRDGLPSSQRVVELRGEDEEPWS